MQSTDSNSLPCWSGKVASEILKHGEAQKTSIIFLAGKMRKCNQLVGGGFPGLKPEFLEDCSRSTAREVLQRGN
jgi:hypothetical protein